MSCVGVLVTTFGNSLFSTAKQNRIYKLECVSLAHVYFPYILYDKLFVLCMAGGLGIQVFHNFGMQYAVCSMQKSCQICFMIKFAKNTSFVICSKNSMGKKSIVNMNWCILKVKNASYHFAWMLFFQFI
jgi:hypothetical protein